MTEEDPQAGRPSSRRRRSPSGKRPWQFSLAFLFVLTTICAVLLSLFNVARRFPLESLIMATVIAIAVSGVILYIWELVIIGWIVDFLSELGMPKFLAKPVPLEWGQVGEIVVVKLRDNIATVLHCQLVEKQLKHLINEHHCDFVLDFSQAGNVSRSFRQVMLHLMKAARKEAGALGKPYFAVAPSHGGVFRVFDDWQRAVEEMSKHGGHGWVVLCSVPVGIRAVSEQG